MSKLRSSTKVKKSICFGAPSSDYLFMFQYTAKNRKSTEILRDKRYEKYPDDYVENLYEVFRVFPNGENM